MAENCRIERDDLRTLGVQVLEHHDGRVWTVAAFAPGPMDITTTPVALLTGRGRRRLLRELADKVRDTRTGGM